jgi:hypothetical protein
MIWHNQRCHHVTCDRGLKQITTDGLKSMEYTLPQQPETCAAIALPLDELELIDEACNLPVGIVIR